MNLNEAALHEDDAVAPSKSASAAAKGKPANSSVRQPDDVIGRLAGASPVPGKRERRRVSESSTGGPETTADLASPGTRNTTATTTTLPQTLSYLVLFWDELCKSTSKKIADNHVTTGPGPRPSSEALTSATKFKMKKEDCGGGGGGGGGGGKVAVSAKKSSHAKSIGPAVPPPPSSAALRGNLFGAAADQLLAKVSAADKDFEVLCELCGEEFAHPVTYHMRQAHPGCGKPAGGQGYNSGGNFCGGWAGSCGDGGVGGSTWYLMCDVCRAKYLRDKKKGGGAGRKERTKKPVVSAGDVLSRRKSTPTAVNTAPTEPHWIVYHNAMFVLELSGGKNMTSSSSSAAGNDWKAGGLSAVSEDTRTGEPSSFGHLSSTSVSS